MFGRLSLLALPHEVLAHGAAGIWCDILEWSSGRSAGDDDDGVFHRPFFLELLDNGGDGGIFLPHGNIDANDRVFGAPPSFLVNDGIDGDSGFACFAITDDKFSLTSTDGDH